MNAVSGNYLAQVLRDRGYPAPSPAAVCKYVEQLPGSELASLAGLVRSLELATEATSDVTDLIDRIKANPPAARQSPPSVPRQRPNEDGARMDPAEISMLRQHGLHAYGKTGAAKMELDLVQGSRDDAKTYTVRLEGTKAGAGGYDWERKIIFQFTVRELPLLAAFLLGYSRSKVFEAKNHGRNGNKSLLLEDQGKHHFLRMAEPGAALVALPIAPPEVFGLAELVLTALAKNRPSVAPEAILTMLRRIGTMA